MGYKNNVFINYPFDDEYSSLLRPLLFTIIRLGFKPRIALEVLESGKPRIERIIALIEESKYGIHDLSRLKARKKGEFFRLNMPFELGIDVGCRLYRRHDKKCLILETERYRYQAAISDLSNSDIEVHGDDPQQLIRVVRKWLLSQSEIKKAPGPASIWAQFADFMAANYEDLIAQGFNQADIDRLSVGELIVPMKKWVEGLTGQATQ